MYAEEMDTAKEPANAKIMWDGKSFAIHWAVINGEWSHWIYHRSFAGKIIPQHM